MVKLIPTMFCLFSLTRVCTPISSLGCRCGSGQAGRTWRSHLRPREEWRQHGGLGWCGKSDNNHRLARGAANHHYNSTRGTVTSSTHYNSTPGTAASDRHAHHHHRRTDDHYDHTASYSNKTSSDNTVSAGL